MFERLIYLDCNAKECFRKYLPQEYGRVTAGSEKKSPVA